MHKFKVFAAIAMAIGVYATPGVAIKAVTEPNPAQLTQAADQAAPAPLHMRITAYSSTPDQTDDTPFITASGLHVRDGLVASNILPFGTKVKIPDLFGNKIFTVADRMSKRIKNTIDIWMPTRGKAIFFGVHSADVVLVPPDNNLSLKDSNLSLKDK